MTYNYDDDEIVTVGEVATAYSRLCDLRASLPAAWLYEHDRNSMLRTLRRFRKQGSQQVNFQYRLREMQRGLVSLRRGQIH